MTVDDVFRIWRLALAKNQQEGYGTRQNFFDTINQGQRQYLDYLMGSYQKYQIQRPISVVEFGQTQRIRESLVPLIYGVVLHPNPTTGIATYPSDYEYVDNMWGVYGFYNIKFIQQDRLDSYLHSTIDPVQTNPVYLIQYEGFHFFPETIGDTRMSYIRTPPSIVWGFRLDENGRERYDPSTSQDPVWSEMDIIQIIVRALEIMGVSLQVGMINQYANEIKNVGG